MLIYLFYVFRRFHQPANLLTRNNVNHYSLDPRTHKHCPFALFFSFLNTNTFVTVFTVRPQRLADLSNRFGSSSFISLPALALDESRLEAHIQL